MPQIETCCFVLRSYHVQPLPLSRQLPPPLSRIATAAARLACAGAGARYFLFFIFS
jgi:hypothetical protein